MIESVKFPFKPSQFNALLPNHQFLYQEVTYKCNKLIILTILILLKIS